MEKYDFMFVVLVYRNTKDLEDFNDSLKNIIGTYKVIVVESFYDTDTSKKFAEISKRYQYDFISVENKGYSYGNNCGIEYAKEKYDFKYLIVSNADIIIDSLDINKLDKMQFDIMGPKIIRKDGRNQNPVYIKQTYVNTHYLGHVYQKFSKIKFLIYILLYKLQNCIYSIFRNNNYVYAVHGSFIIFSKLTLEKLGKVFDENMFLFFEENVLAYKCKEQGLKVLYDKDTKIYHKEDGSMKLSKQKNLSEELKKSYNYFYENYVMSNKK